MERNTRSIIPNMNNKPRSNGPISPREINSNYNHHQSSSHYNNYHQSHQNNHHNPQQQQQNNNSYHPNLDLINYVSSVWKEKMSSDKIEYFKDNKTENSTEKFCNFDVEGFLMKMRNS